METDKNNLKKKKDLCTKQTQRHYIIKIKNRQK